MSNWETAVTLQASASQNAHGNGAAVDLGTRDRLLRQALLVTAQAGGSSPSLTVRLEASADGVAGWKTFGTFTAATVVTSEKLSFVSPERYVRVAWTIGGSSSPSFTFAVSGTKGISFANLDQFDALGLPAASMSGLSGTKKVEGLAAATELASGILSVRYTLPIVAWGNDLSQAVCKLGAYDLLSVRGFNPDGDDQNVRMRYDDALKWLMAVANSKANAMGLVDSSTTPTTPEDGGGVEIVTHSPRGWR